MLNKFRVLGVCGAVRGVQGSVFLRVLGFRGRYGWGGGCRIEGLTVFRVFGVRVFETLDWLLNDFRGVGLIGFGGLRL